VHFVGLSLSSLLKMHGPKNKTNISVWILWI